MLNSVSPHTFEQYAQQYLLGVHLAFNSYTISESDNTTWIDNQYHKKYKVIPFKFNSAAWGALLLPEDKNDKDVHVIFRGTISSTESWLVNIEMWGAGYESFETSKEGIFQSIDEAITEHYGHHSKDLKLTVNGHSQGGALSQLFTTEFLKRRLQNNECALKFSDLTLNAFCSTGVPLSVAMDFDSFAQQNADSQSRLNIIANYGIIGGDPVSSTGSDTIGATTDPRYATVNLLKLKGIEGELARFLNASRTFDDGFQLHDLYYIFVFYISWILETHPIVKFDWTKQEHFFLTNQDPQDIRLLKYELLFKSATLMLISFLISTTKECARESGLSAAGGCVGDYSTRFVGWLRDKFIWNYSKENEAPPSLEEPSTSSSPSKSA